MLCGKDKNSNVDPNLNFPGPPDNHTGLFPMSLIINSTVLYFKHSASHLPITEKCDTEQICKPIVVSSSQKPKVHPAAEPTGCLATTVQLSHSADVPKGPLVHSLGRWLEKARFSAQKKKPNQQYLVLVLLFLSSRILVRTLIHFAILTALR